MSLTFANLSNSCIANCFSPRPCFDTSLFRPGSVGLPLQKAVLQRLSRFLCAARGRAENTSYSVVVDPCDGALPLADDRIGVRGFFEFSTLTVEENR